MLWYFNNEQAYDYLTDELINNTLANKFKESVYGESEITDLYYALSYMKLNHITDLAVIFPLNELSVNYGRENDANIEFCKKNNIQYRYENRSGGCMVFFPGNIIIHNVYPGDTFLRQHQFVNDFVEWLHEKGIEAKTDNNDVMIDKKKIIGTVSETLPIPYKGWIYFAVQISINIDPYIIFNVCQKPSVKSPGQLSDYNITTEEVMTWILNWFNEQGIAEVI